MKTKTYFSLFLVLVILFSLGCSSQKEKEEELKKKDSQTNRFAQAPTLTAREKEIIDYSRASLIYLAQSSSMAKQILEFYDSSATLARYVDEKSIQVIERPKSDQSFFVYAIPTDREFIPNGVYVVALFNSDIRALAVYDCQFSKLVHGLYFAHELTHARDFVFGLESNSEPLSPEWLTGELRAHATVSSILNEVTNNEWEWLAQESRTERESWATTHGLGATAFTFGTAPNDSLRLSQLFGQLNHRNLSALMTQLVIEANLLNIVKYAGSDQTAFMRDALEFLSEFYNRYQTN